MSMLSAASTEESVPVLVGSIMFLLDKGFYLAKTVYSSVPRVADAISGPVSFRRTLGGDGRLLIAHAAVSSAAAAAAEASQAALHENDDIVQSMITFPPGQQPHA